MIQYQYSLPLIDDFFLFLETNNYSPKTLYNYKNDLAIFDGFLKFKNLKFEKLTKRGLFDFKVYLYSEDRKTATTYSSTQRKLASATINRCISAFHSYLRFLIDQDFPTPVVPDMIKTIKREKYHPHIAEFADMVSIIELPSKLETRYAVGERNRAMLEMLFSTGMRIGELINLNRTDLNDEGKIFVLGKGRKERYVYLTDRAKQYLSKYLNLRTDKENALFISSGRSTRLSCRYVQERIQFYKNYLKIGVKVTPHSFRHGFATYLAEQGASPAAIQILLGHESLNTTTRYINASDKFAQDTHKKFHPLGS